jgi:hypothetical protein
MEMHLGEQSQTCAKTFAETAKPLRIGSIPIAAFKTSICSTNYGHTSAIRFRVHHSCIATLLVVLNVD